MMDTGHRTPDTGHRTPGFAQQGLHEARVPAGAASHDQECGALGMVDQRMVFPSGTVLLGNTEGRPGGAGGEFPGVYGVQPYTPDLAASKAKSMARSAG
ncbi:hypothetical protein [Streptomyces sp. NPDC004546]|uniref:hypothetical protein n=1 Tax=Streptomyces sp. NPDC004546 TaxID=3154282 RepID=UPI0033B7A3F7